MSSAREAGSPVWPTSTCAAKTDKKYYNVSIHSQASSLNIRVTLTIKDLSKVTSGTSKYI